MTVAGRGDDHLLLAFDGPTVPDEVLAAIAAGGVPGVTLFRYANVRSPDQVASTTAALEAANPSDLPLLVAADQETGQLVGLGDDTTAFPGAMALGAVGDPDLARRVGAAVGRECRAMGVTVAYAPVCDVATNPANPALGVRSFGDDPAAVATMAAAMAAGLADVGVVAVAKHFPGAGEAVTDPHHGLPVLDVDRAHLDAVELVPFGTAVDDGVPAIMVGHYGMPAISGRRDVASSIDPGVVTDLLRGDLGFDGVVVTDALDMGALPQGDDRADAALAALAAGVDLLLCAPTTGHDDAAPPDAATGSAMVDPATADTAGAVPAPMGLRRALHDALGRGRVSPDVLAAARTRIERLRAWLAGFERPGMEVVGCDGHRALALEVARRATTLVRDDGLLPMARTGRLVAVMPTPTDLTPADTSSTVRPGLAAALRRHHDDVVEVVVAREPTADDIADVVAQVARADAVVVGTIWAGPSQAAMVQAILATGTPTATVALRTPFDLASYPDATTHLCTFSIHEPSMAALADVLFGIAPASGHLPVAIPGLYATGHGMATTRP